MEKSLPDVSIAAGASGSGLGTQRLLESSDDDDINPTDAGSKRRRETSDDDLEADLEAEMERAGIDDAAHTKGKGKSKAIVPISPEDCVARYHEMIRRALVDWGDHVLDNVAARFDDAKTIQAVEEVRKENIDPLRTWSAL